MSIHFYFPSDSPVCLIYLVLSWFYTPHWAYALLNTPKDWFWTVEIYLWKLWSAKVTLPQITLVMINFMYFFLHFLLNFCCRGLSLCGPLEIMLRVKRTWNQTTEGDDIVLQDLARRRCALSYDAALGHQRAYIATGMGKYFPSKNHEF